MHSSSVAGVACRAPTLARWLVAICLTVLPCAAGPPVAFRTGGGDAWTFEKRIEVSVPDGLCDDVVIASSVALVTAEPRAGTVVARIPLGPGDNTIAAECRMAGRTVRPIAHQRWHVRLNDVPSARPSVYVTGGRLELDGNDSASAPSTTAPIVTYAWRGSQQNPAPLAGLPTEGRRVALPVPSRDGEYRVTLRVMDAVGRANEGMVVFRVVKGTATAPSTRCRPIRTGWTTRDGSSR